MDKLREIDEQDFIAPDDTGPAQGAALSLDATLEDKVTLQLNSYSNYTIALMEELTPLWQWHQVCVRWVDSMNDQQYLDYGSCKWDTADTSNSGTLAMNNYKEAADLNSTSMRIENLRVIRISPSILEAEVHGTKFLPIQSLIPNNTQEQVVGKWCENL